MFTVMNGTMISQLILNSIKKEIKYFKRSPKLAIFYVGNNLNSKLYVENKIKAGKQVGIEIQLYKFDEEISEDELIKNIKEANTNDSIDGIIVQLPLPPQVHRIKIANVISYLKDVDGLNNENQKNFLVNKKSIISPTALGVKKLLDFYEIDVNNKKIVVIGQGLIAGLPISTLLKNNGANVEVCTDQTNDISIYTKKADILISAVGKKHLITKDIVKNGATVINVGFDKGEGDVDFENVKNVTSFISPIKNGTGPLTVAFLLKNVVDCYKIKEIEK